MYWTAAPSTAFTGSIPRLFRVKGEFPHPDARNFPQSLECRSVEGDFGGLVLRSSSLVLLVLQSRGNGKELTDVCCRAVVENAGFPHGHPVQGERARLVRADDGDGAQGLDGGKRLMSAFLLPCAGSPWQARGSPWEAALGGHVRHDDAHGKRKLSQKVLPIKNR